MEFMFACGREGKNVLSSFYIRENKTLNTNEKLCNRDYKFAENLVSKK